MLIRKIENIYVIISYNITKIEKIKSIFMKIKVI